MRYSTFGMAILLSVFCHATERDPFQPLSAPERCQQAGARPESWRLLGIIGRKGDYRGWLQQAQTRRISVATGDTFTTTSWRVNAVGPRYVQLQGQDACADRKYLFQLQGGNP